MRRILIPGVAVAVIASAAGCTATNPKGSGTQSSTSHTLTVDVASDIDTLDPAVTIDNASWKITYPCYERLVDYQGSSTQLQPGLAKSWSSADGGKVWTFHLAAGHKFTDGTPVDANAVKFSFDRLLKINQGPAGSFAEVSKVEAPNPTTVKFVLNSPFAPFPSTLATNYASIVDPKVMDHQQNGDMGQAYLASHTMGSGAYELKSRVKGQSLTLATSPTYSGSKPQITKAVFQIVSDPSAQRLQLEKGDVDVAEGITIDQLKSLQGDSGLTVLKKPSLLVDYIYLNVGKGNAVLKNTKVRQAISYAIDYKGLINATQQGQAVQMRGPIPQGMWGHDQSVTQYNYDPAKAKQLLAEAHVGKVPPLTLLYSDHEAWWPTEALAIQANLQKIGIPVKLSKVEYATERALLDKGQFDLSLGVWSPDYADPYMFMNFWFDSNNGGLAGNRAFYSNPQVDQLIRQAAVSTSQSQREQLYQQAQKIVVQDPPYVYLYQTNFMLPMRSNVHGFVFNPMLQGIYDLAQMSKA